jgi:hypothetical protein
MQCILVYMDWNQFKKMIVVIGGWCGSGIRRGTWQPLEAIGASIGFDAWKSRVSGRVETLSGTNSVKMLWPHVLLNTLRNVVLCFI